MARLSEDPARAVAQLGLESYADRPDIAPVLVSRMPLRKMSGPLHKDTVYSARHIKPSGIVAEKKLLTELTAADLVNLVAPETNKQLYDAIRARMSECGNDARKAFSEPFFKPINPDPKKPDKKETRLRA